MFFNTFIKQTEINSGGGVRISAYMQAFGPTLELVTEVLHAIYVGPFDDFDHIIAENSAAIQRMGYPAIDPDELALTIELRAVARDNPKVKERMAVEAQRIAERIAAEEEQARQHAQDEAKAEAERQAADVAAEAEAEALKQAETEQRRSEIAQAVAEAMATRKDA